MLTNDDGIHAQGLEILESIARELSDDVVVVAPESDQSGVAHSLSLSDPLRLREISPRHYAVKGTPTDCVIMAVRMIMANDKPDLVLSGVNRGQNVAEDVTYSGTIAGAMEGAILGVPAIALSQAYGGADGPDNDRVGATEAHAAPLIRKILAAGIPPGGLVNVNFPFCAAGDVRASPLPVRVSATRELMRVEERRDGRGFPYYWLMFQRGEMQSEDGTDLEALAAQKISVTPLQARSHRRASTNAAREGVRGPVTGIDEPGGGAALSASEAEERAQFTLAMRARGIDDLELLRALERAPRALLHAAALSPTSPARDIALPIGCGQTSPPPSVLAAMIEALGLEPRTGCAKSEPEQAIAPLCSRNLRGRSCRSSASRRWRSRPPPGSRPSASAMSRCCGATDTAFIRPESASIR